MTKKIETLDDANDAIKSVNDFLTKTFKNHKDMTDLLVKAMQKAKDESQKK